MRLLLTYCHLFTGWHLSLHHSLPTRSPAVRWKQMKGHFSSTKDRHFHRPSNGNDSKLGPQHFLPNWVPNLHSSTSPILNRKIFLRYQSEHIDSFPKTCPIASRSYRGSSPPFPQHPRIASSQSILLVKGTASVPAKPGGTCLCTSTFTCCFLSLSSIWTLLTMVKASERSRLIS